MGFSRLHAALAALALGAALLPVAPPAVADEPPPIVRVGDVSVQGAISDGVSVFKGIPYAADTGGQNRFRAPQPLTDWHGTFNAMSYGPICPGFGGLPPPGAQEAPEGNDPNLTSPSEDCLRLNVWTPAADGKKRPVMVFVHGGGFVTGSGNLTWYDGANLARNDDVVFVTIDYRLNSFGFLDLAAIDPGYAGDTNAGLQDIVAGLKWVNANIAAFGGNPANITLMGQSAGADSAILLMGIPAAAGLFEKVIAESPSDIPPLTADEAAGRAHGVLDALGIGPDLKGLADVPWDKLMAGYAGNVPWVDGSFIPADFSTTAAPSKSPSVPLLIGWNATENTFFEGPDAIADDKALREALTTRLKLSSFAGAVTQSYKGYYPSASPGELYFRITADLESGKTVLAVANQKSHLGRAPVYVYRFDAKTEVRNLMTPHGLEIGYALDNLSLTKAMTGELTAAKAETAAIVSHAWTSFARTGEPSAPGLPHWPIYRTRADSDASMDGIRELQDPVLMSLDQSPEVLQVPARTKALTGQ